MLDLSPRAGDLEAIETASRDELTALQLELGPLTPDVVAEVDRLLADSPERR